MLFVVPGWAEIGAESRATLPYLTIGIDIEYGVWRCDPESIAILTLMPKLKQSYASWCFE